jgi:hypothetical protein
MRQHYEEEEMGAKGTEPNVTVGDEQRPTTDPTSVTQLRTDDAPTTGAQVNRDTQQWLLSLPAQTQENIVRAYDKARANAPEIPPLEELQPQQILRLLKEAGRPVEPSKPDENNRWVTRMEKPPEGSTTISTTARNLGGNISIGTGIRSTIPLDNPKEGSRHQDTTQEGFFDHLTVAGEVDYTPSSEKATLRNVELGLVHRDVSPDGTEEVVTLKGGLTNHGGSITKTQIEETLTKRGFQSFFSNGLIMDPVVTNTTEGRRETAGKTTENPLVVYFYGGYGVVIPQSELEALSLYVGSSVQQPLEGGAGPVGTVEIGALFERYFTERQDGRVYAEARATAATEPFDTIDRPVYGHIEVGVDAPVADWARVRGGVRADIEGEVRTPVGATFSLNEEDTVTLDVGSTIDPADPIAGSNLEVKLETTLP